MEVAEIQTRKNELEREILLKIKKFENETGCSVADAGLVKAEHVTRHGLKTNVLRVTVEVKI